MPNTPEPLTLTQVIEASVAGTNSGVSYNKRAVAIATLYSIIQYLPGLDKEELIKTALELQEKNWNYERQKDKPL